MAISPQQLTIYLYSAHRAVIFAIAQLSCSMIPPSDRRTDGRAIAYSALSILCCRALKTQLNRYMGPSKLMHPILWVKSISRFSFNKRIWKIGHFVRGMSFSTNTCRMACILWLTRILWLSVIEFCSVFVHSIPFQPTTLFIYLCMYVVIYLCNKCTTWNYRALVRAHRPYSS